MHKFLLTVVIAAAAMFMSTISASAESFPVMCRGGGGMTAQMGSSGGSSIIVRFVHARQGYLTAKPGKGECAWSDRAMNDKEPTTLLLQDAASMGGLLMSGIKGGIFSINAFTNGGLLEITSVNIAEDDGGGSDVSQMPSEMPVPDTGAIVGTDFSGDWDSQTDDGDEFTLALEQNGKIVSGSFESNDGRHGAIKGAIKGGVLSFAWRIGKARGTGEFELSDDGESFEGSYVTKGSGKEGVWSGARQ